MRLYGLVEVVHQSADRVFKGYVGNELLNCGGVFDVYFKVTVGVCRRKSCAVEVYKVCHVLLYESGILDVDFCIHICVANYVRCGLINGERGGGGS